MSRWAKGAGTREHKEKFACRCSGEDERECDEVLDFVKQKLDVTEHNFVSRVVASLSWQYNASITGILSDQWFGISSDTYEEEDGLSTFVQCDMVEDGLAYTWKLYYDRYGDEHPLRPMEADERTEH